MTPSLGYDIMDLINKTRMSKKRNIQTGVIDDGTPKGIALPKQAVPISISDDRMTSKIPYNDEYKNPYRPKFRIKIIKGDE